MRKKNTYGKLPVSVFLNKDSFPLKKKKKETGDWSLLKSDGKRNMSHTGMKLHKTRFVNIKAMQYICDPGAQSLHMDI